MTGNGWLAWQINSAVSRWGLYVDAETSAAKSTSEQRRILEALLSAKPPEPVTIEQFALAYPQFVVS